MVSRNVAVRSKCPGPPDGSLEETSEPSGEGRRGIVLLPMVACRATLMHLLPTLVAARWAGNSGRGGGLTGVLERELGGEGKATARAAFRDGDAARLKWHQTTV